MRDKVVASFLLTIGLTMLMIGLYFGQLAQIGALVRVISDVGVAGIP